MDIRQKLNHPLAGIAGGFVLPLMTTFIFYLATSQGMTIPEYFRHALLIGNLTRVMSVAVFSNIIIFLVFNKFDMLRASKGVLGITIVWALMVFAIKLF